MKWNRNIDFLQFHTYGRDHNYDIRNYDIITN